MKRTVALIYGGEGFEHEISIKGAKNISSWIDRSEYNLISVFISKSGEWFIDDGNRMIPTFPIFLYGKSGFFKNGEIIQTDVAIPLLHGNFGEDGTVCGALSTAHIRFIGCDVLAGAVCSDKIVTKLIADALKIPTAKWLFSSEKFPDFIVEKAEAELGYPMYIKPSGLGSSIGISQVFNREQFLSAYINSRRLCERILVEKKIYVKSELECAYLEESGKKYFKIGRVFSDGGFYDFDRKYLTNTRTEAVCTDRNIEKTVTHFSEMLVSALGIRQISRLDFFLSEDGKIIFNEINTLPGMTKTSLYPQLTVEMGFSEGEFINRLISEALL